MIVLDTNLVSIWINPRDAKRYPKAFARVDSLLAVQGLSISAVTQFELRRGVEKLLRQGAGRSKLVTLEKFLDRVEVLGLDGPGGGGWNVAARLWADAATHKPALTFTDGDLLIAATAAFHRRPLATAEVGLAEGLEKLGFPTGVQLVAQE